MNNDKNDDDFIGNWEFQKKFYQKIIEILKENAFHFIDISTASEYEDKNQATDFIITLEGGEIALRIRRSNYEHRDLTLRYSTRYGNKTEFEKIKDGFAKYYLYCWTKEDDKKNEYIDEYMLVDLDELRKSGYLNKKFDPIPNKDGGTSFVFIPIHELKELNCLVSYKIDDKNKLYK